MARYKGTISVAPDPVAFGSYISVGYTTDHPKPWAKVEVAGPTGLLQVSWVNLWDGHDTCPMGPTPSWSGGPGNGTATLGYFTSRGRWTVIATTTFAVTG